MKRKRLVIAPMSDTELHDLIDQTADEGLKQAYGEMLMGCESHPDECLWYTAWKICLKESGEEIGSAGFKGAQTNGAVELGYGINSGFEGKGYADESARALIDWAFSQEDVFFVEAETAPDNAASIRVLEKLKFRPDGEGTEGPRFLLEKPASALMSVYMCIGMSVGMCLGVSFDETALGMCLGMSIGLCIGLSLDGADKKKRESLKAKRRQNEDGKQ
ncbi:MAG: GNAT family N-acetyltransferase [Oscillospiraceae bacterium]|nr:GNAT family N-acetyltransferase [Oscillospiraceae bacterium]